MEIRVWPVAMLGILLGGCAAAPQKPAPKVASTTTPLSGAEYDARLAEAAKRAKEMGYHIETRHGDQFYCRTVAPIGSRLTEKECLTVDTMVQTARMAEENQVSQRQGQLCQGNGCVIH
jgi:hypothetical protein